MNHTHSYKQNYLKQVIFRIDFDRVNLSNFEDYKKLTEKEFDHSEKKKNKINNFEFNVDSGKMLNNQSSVDVWTFENSQNKNKLDISQDHCLIEYYTYKNSSILMGDVKTFFVSFLKMHNIRDIRRIGLRYINEIELSGVRKLADWSKYINDSLLTYSTFSSQGKTLTRFINNVEFKSNDFNASFKFGIWNNKYPSPITNSAFILDVDCFTRVPTTFSNEDELSNYVSKLNKEAETIFEESIKEQLRKEMEK